MRRFARLNETSVGKKIVMALSGLVLFGFVIAHMLGNLKIYQGADKFNAYAEFLHEMGAPVLGKGQLLWLLRFALLGAVGAHVVSAAQLWRASRRARGGRYVRRDDLSFSYASRTMRWGGVILAAFVVYHVLHLTIGTVHPEFEHGSVYANVINGFRAWPASLAYIVAMVPLALHIYHGVWSATQTLNIDDGRVRRFRRPLAAGFAIAIFIGNVSIPVAVLTGLLRTP